MAKQPHKGEQSYLWILQLLLVLFSVLTVPHNPPLAMGELTIVVLVWVYLRRDRITRQRELIEYLEKVTGDIETPVEDNLERSPFPVLVYRPETGRIIWANHHFKNILGQSKDIAQANITDLIPDFEGRWLIEGKPQSPHEEQMADRRFFVYGSLVRGKERGRGGYLAATYWLDITEFSKKREELIATRPTVSVITLDNYEDLMRNLTDSQSATLLSAINKKLSEWVDGSHGVFKRYTRENYLLIVEQQHLQQLIEKKFDIIDNIREIVNPHGIAATLSIGIGKDGESLEEMLQFANLSIDMALSRGGDQVVIRNKVTFEFYGGRAKETEKHTKVKSRVMANSLAGLIADSSRVFIMGHVYPDMDVVGAAAGVFALARKKNTPSFIIRHGKDSSAEVLYDKLEKNPEYQEKYVTAQEALFLADSRSLLVVVDVNRPDRVQAPEFLESCNRVAVIDHHRRTSTYIENTLLNYHELYASSACEMVAEILQYTVEATDLHRDEAEALLAGIVLDTKNFTIRTGARTFEAASFLRRCGADTNEVKKLFQNNLEEAKARYQIVQTAQAYKHDSIVMAWSEEEVERVIASQAADELLGISGVQTSFVIFQKEEQVMISARSMGDINVQLIMEKMGGGGNAAAAAAQLEIKSVPEGIAQLKQAIDTYLQEEIPKEKR